MYIKILNNIPTPYSIGKIRSDNPQVSFPEDIPEATLAGYDVFPVQPTEPPNAGALEVVQEAGFQLLEDGSWAQAWSIRAMTSDELAMKSQYEDAQRRSAYQLEADPLFFKWQRGEATKEQWLDKVAEIKASLEQGGV